MEAIGTIAPPLSIHATQGVDPTTGQLTGPVGFLNSILMICFMIMLLDGIILKILEWWVEALLF